MIVRSIITAALGMVATCIMNPESLAGEASSQVVTIDFEKAEIGERVESWEDHGVTFTPAHPPKKSKAKGRIMFFPHIASGHKGLLNAMADEAIPLRAEFPSPVKMVELKLWGSTTSAAVVEAFDTSGNLIDRTSVDHVPVRQRPEDPVPIFDLAIQGRDIASIQISGSQPGGFIAVDELRFHPQSVADAPTGSDNASPVP